MRHLLCVSILIDAPFLHLQSSLCSQEVFSLCLCAAFFPSLRTTRSTPLILHAISIVAFDKGCLHCIWHCFFFIQYLKNIEYRCLSPIAATSLTLCIQADWCCGVCVGLFLSWRIYKKLTCRSLSSGTMAVPPAYSDLGKSAKDIFSKGYGNTQGVYDINVKSGSSVYATNIIEHSVCSVTVTAKLIGCFRATLCRCFEFPKFPFSPGYGILKLDVKTKSQSGVVSTSAVL